MEEIGQRMTAQKTLKNRHPIQQRLGFRIGILRQLFSRHCFPIKGGKHVLGEFILDDFGVFLDGLFKLASPLDHSGICFNEGIEDINATDPAEESRIELL